MLGRKAKHVNSASLFHWRDGKRGKLCLVTGNDEFPVLAYFRIQPKALTEHRLRAILRITPLNPQNLPYEIWQAVSGKNI
jgi:hypothetical protein